MFSPICKGAWFENIKLQNESIFPEENDWNFLHLLFFVFCPQQWKKKKKKRWDETYKVRTRLLVLEQQQAFQDEDKAMCKHSGLI